MRINPSAGCTGCSACFAVCAHGAIEMVQDKRGFYIPRVDPEKCVDCGLCQRVCPLHRQKETRDAETCACTYLYIKNEKEREKSCSGGVFYALAVKTLERGGLVCGCVWDENFVARHICTDNLEDVKRMRGAKYVQSHMGECFRQIKKALQEGQEVLFCGTPCQVTALNGYVGQKHSQKLLTVGLICGGTPSPKVWQKYKEAVEKQVGGSLTLLDMRSKRRGWLVSELHAEFSNKRKVQEVLYSQNLYGTNFVQGLFINDHCMNCSFKLDTIAADIMIGDHWGIEPPMLKETKNKGASVAVILTQKGEEALASLSDVMVMYPGDIQKTIKSHGVLLKDHVPNPWREEFFQKMDDEDMIVLLQNYYDAWESKVKRNPLIRLLYKWKLYTPLFTLKWKVGR